MSRQVLPVERVCKYIEMDEYYSPSRGELHLTYICHHPDHDGCLCVLNGSSVAECDKREDVEGVKTVRL